MDLTLAKAMVANFHRRMVIEHHEEWQPKRPVPLQQIAENMQAYAASLEPLIGEAPNVNVKVLRAHLMIEELAEFLLADDEVTALDGLTDLLYVLLGTAVAYDWPIASAFEEVHISNMTKVPQPDDPSRARVRKKGEEFKAPTLEEILDRYRKGRIRG